MAVSSLNLDQQTQYVDADNGWTTSIVATGISNFLLGSFPRTPAHAFYNLGANDFPGIQAGTITSGTWQSQTGAILDAIHAKWPSLSIHVWRPWRRTYNTESDTLSGWLDTVLSTRGTFASVGTNMDERVLIKSSDDGATYTYDGIHYNASGALLISNTDMAVLGF